MSIKDLFNKKVAFFDNATSGSSKVESKDLVISTFETEDQFIPNIDFSSGSNFAKFGSAKLYYKTALERIYNDYPYDGSRNEKVLFELSSSYLDRWIFNNKYPKSTGYINFSYGGWGSLNGSLSSDGYGLPSSPEYIYVRGGMPTASIEDKPLWKIFDNSIVYDSSKGRTTTFELNMTEGFTVEFWLKKDAFDITKTKKEVIFDLWNSKASSSSEYGRFTLELSGTSTGTDTFRVTLQSGSNGFFDQAIGTSTVTTSSLGNWKHYALSFVSASAGMTSRLYVDGNLNEKKTLGSTGIGTVGGLLSGYLGALQTSPSGSSAAQFSGKLSASLDEFRVWKTRRTSEQIYNNWHRDVGGGTNTDDANIKLSLYYKFNEGIVGNPTHDGVVLDYSGRIANGLWTGYTAGARNTGSAFLSSSHAIVETGDPIIRSVHPDVVSVISELEQSGSEWDLQNTTNLYFKTVPDWIKEEDEDQGGDNVKHLYQIISSYFDTLYSQITSITSLKDTQYPTEQGKAIPFAKKLVESKGLIVNDILLNSTLLERVEKVDDNKNHFESSVSEIKNLIYTNLYNNMDAILKSKGNEKSIRNTLRCFGIDDELIKLNIYTDGGMHYFSDKYRQTSLMKKYISFFDTSRFNATIFQTSSANNSLTYITGSDSGQKEINSAFTVETSVMFPKTIDTFESSHFKIPFKKSSIFGAHEAAASSGDYTWDSTDIANFQIYVEREKLNSDKAKFILETSDGSTVMSSSYFPEVYANQNWNLAVRLKPEKYPFQGNVVQTSTPTYTLEFYGVNHAFGTVQSEFLLTSSLSNASGSAFLTKSKRFYVGAHRTNFTGSVLNKTDVKIGGFRFYLDYLSNDTIKQHNLDPLSHGLDRTYKSPTMFAVDMGDKHVISSDLLAINWDFETVTGSDSSGRFIVDDLSSGSSGGTYGWIDNVAKVENRGYGFGFPTSNRSIQKNEVIFTNRKQQPEISYNSDKVIIESEERKNFITDEDVSDNFYSIEKSMSQVISDEMLKMLSSVVEFNDLIGKATDRYRDKYKNLDLLRRIFYEKVEETPDFDKFTRYYKWIDSSISLLVSQLFPISARNSKQISDIVESHILERNKYQNKFPLVKKFESTESPIKGSSEMRYNWKFGHAPVDGDDNKNQAWQKLRKERSNISNREILRKVLITENEIGKEINVAKADLTIYQKSTFATRRLSKPYRISQDLKPDIHGGINYPPKKNRDIIYHLTHRHGEKGNLGQPLNVVVAGAGTGSGINPQQERDILDPNLKTRVNLDVVSGRYSDNLYTPGPKNADSTYAHRLTELDIPVTVISESVNSGYNSHVVNRFDSGSIVTNIHSDTTTLTNDIPMQGPFAETWVGGHQHRHVSVNRHDTSLRDDDTGTAPPNNLDNKYTRPEAWMLKLGDYTNNDGAIGIVGPDYGGPYPDPARKVAVFYREERAKRPFNIKNIRYTTGSRNLGNFRENYELISAGGKLQNNLYLRKNPDQSLYLPTKIGNKLPLTTHPMSLFGQAPYPIGNVFGTQTNNRQPDGDVTTTSFTVTGSSVSGAAAGTFRVNQIGLGGQDVDTTFRFNNSGIGTKNFIIKSGSVPSDSDPNYYVATGSSNINFWNNLKNKMNSVLTNYNIDRVSTNTSYGLNLFSSASVSSKTALTASSISDFNNGRFTFSCWLSVTGGTALAKKTIFSFKSGSGEASRELYLSGGHLYYESIFHYGGTQRCHVFNKYPSYEANWDRAGWKHIILTDNQTGTGFPTEVSLYLDNVLTASTNIVSSSTSGIGGCSSGGAQRVESDGNIFFLNDTLDATSNPWQGGIDEITFWNNLVLNASQRAEIYNNGAIAKIMACHISGSNLKAWYNFEDQKGLSGEVILDKSGNGNHLTASSTAGPVYHITSSGITSVPEETYANFTINALTGGASYDATLTVTTACQNFISNVEAPSGGFLSGAMSPDTIEFGGKRFQILNSLNPTPAGSNIGVSADFGTSNSTFWNNFSQSIKNNTVFDTINIVTSSGGAGHPQATFHLTSSIGDFSSYKFTTVHNTSGKTTFINSSSFSHGTNGGVFDVVIPVITSSVTNTIISSRFSAPGGIEVQSLGYLDVYSREYSVHNSLNYRNLSVRGVSVIVSSSADGTQYRNQGGSGEPNTIRIVDHLGKRDGYKALLSRHCGKFGIDSAYGTISATSYETNASFHKVHQNIARRPTDTSTIESPVFNEDKDNAHISSLLPRSDFQYSWITSSLGYNYGILSGSDPYTGKQRIYGYAPADGIVSSSVSIGGESGFVAAINFPTASEIFGV